MVDLRLRFISFFNLWKEKFELVFKLNGHGQEEAVWRV